MNMHLRFAKLKQMATAPLFPSLFPIPIPIPVETTVDFTPDIQGNKSLRWNIHLKKKCIEFTEKTEKKEKKGKRNCYNKLKY
jgi:hypothetical protein